MLVQHGTVRYGTVQYSTGSIEIFLLQYFSWGVMGIFFDEWEKVEKNSIVVNSGNSQLSVK